MLQRSIDRQRVRAQPACVAHSRVVLRCQRLRLRVTAAAGSGQDKVREGEGASALDNPVGRQPWVPPVHLQKRIPSARGSTREYEILRSLHATATAHCAARACGPCSSWAEGVSRQRRQQPRNAYDSACWSSDPAAGPPHACCDHRWRPRCTHGSHLRCACGAGAHTLRGARACKTRTRQHMCPYGPSLLCTVVQQFGSARDIT